MTETSSSNQPPAYGCSSCHQCFGTEAQHKEHFKSEFHRYNLKRRVISLPSVSYEQFLQQFDDGRDGSMTEKEMRCDLCAKRFKSPRTYAQHTNSAKHRQRAKQQENTRNRVMRKSPSCSSSEFSVVGDHLAPPCLFCKEPGDAEHLAAHNFPPFKQSCRDLQGLKQYIYEMIKSGQCVYCLALFDGPESARQHMLDLGHAMINTQRFEPFQKFYVWRIEEVDGEESEEWEELGDGPKQQTVTLQDVRNYYRGRIHITKTGAKINGNKEIGVKTYKKYYKQYFREIKYVERDLHRAIENKENHTGALFSLLPNKIMKNHKCFPERKLF